MSILAMMMALEALEYPIKTPQEMFFVDVANLLEKRAIEALRKELQKPHKDCKNDEESNNGW